MRLLTSTKSNLPLTPGEVENLLAGLERQKEELGPIAAELIEILVRAGVDPQAEVNLPKIKTYSE